MKLISWLIDIKIMLGRSANYAGLINMGLLGFLALTKLKEMGFIDWNLKLWFIPLMVVTFILLIIIGYIELHIFKGYAREVNQLNDLTPLHPRLTEMKEKIDLMHALQTGGLIYDASSKD